VMYQKRLHILIEGDGDKVFFNEMRPLLKRGYKQIILRKYSELIKEGINKYIDAISKAGDDYILVTDIDKSPCISGKKQERMTEFNSIDDKSKIMVVVRKIESWYTAGLSDDRYNEFGIKPPNDTSKSGKGFFKRLLIKRRLESKLISEIDFMKEILKDFDIETAKQRNTSFRYFIDNYCP